MDYDVIIIGAGMSGLGAGIRLAHFDKRVLIVEQHAIPGGLNSYFRRKGTWIDVGLHAVTNFCPPGDKRAPLNRLLRQLRLDRGDLQIREQTVSRIEFPSVGLNFDNSPETLHSEISRFFPAELDGWNRLIQRVRTTDALSLNAGYSSARVVLAEYITSPLLRDIIFCPVMFYGNACEDDMDFNQFCIMFQALFLEGFWRPFGGMRHIISLLTERFCACGGELRLRSPVAEVSLKGGKVDGVLLANGEKLCAPAVLSSAGYVETLDLCRPVPGERSSHPTGNLGYAETIFVLDVPPASCGVETSITFSCGAEKFRYRRPETPLDCSSCVRCVPGNFSGMNGGLGEYQIRLTRLADPGFWLSADPETYADAKTVSIRRETQELEARYPRLAGHIIDVDMFTPKTIWRYTGHINGSVYGSPGKHRDGCTPVPGLYICGTDQGFLGIVGALLSGVSIANLHLLR